MYGQNKIIHGDCLVILPQLKNTYDVIIADPPYNIGKDFGDGPKQMNITDYVVWSIKWINSCLNVLKDDGILYIYGFPEIIAHIAVNYSLEQQKWLVWYYTNKAVPSSKFWQRSHETILALWKDSKNRPLLNIDDIRETYTPSFLSAVGKVRKDTESRYGTEGKQTIYNAHENGAMPRDVIKIPALSGMKGYSERWFGCLDCNNVYPASEIKNHSGCNTVKHPTQKPMEITRRLIRSKIKNNNGCVLIPFAGTGSECLVAKKMGIDFTSIEINDIWVWFGNTWLQSSDKELTSDLYLGNAKQLALAE